ncbi:MAG: prepilin-type N-terminal cleavage/methylation domain-containing protein [Planctomycetota bacterium]
MILRRGLTLIEVLLAVALLAMLAGVVASAASNLQRASNTKPWQQDFIELSMLADPLLEQVEMPLRVWPEGRSESVTLAVDEAVFPAHIRRMPCPDCPERIGLFEVEAFEQSVLRFSPIASVPTETTQ